MPDDSAIICALVEEGDPIRGSILADCARCFKKVWIAPTGQEILAATGSTILCVPCGLKAIAEDDDPKLMHLTQAQRDELAEELRRRREV